MILIYRIDMPAKLSESVKSGVIQQWLKGVERDRIALGNGLSAGAVTNIVNEWRQAIDFSVADELRELAVTLKKIGITPGECAIGCRASMMLNRVGVGNDQLQSFLSDIYKRSVELGLTPQSIASYLRDLLEFSNTLVLSQIPAYLEQKKEEKDQLEKKIQDLYVETSMLQRQKSDCERLSNAAMEDYNTTTQQLRWYSGLKEELAKYGIIVDDVSYLAKVVDGARALGYDPVKIMNEISNLQLVSSQYIFYQNRLTAVKYELDGLTRARIVLEQLVQSHNQTLSIYDQLDGIGFGLRELKLLYHTIEEISAANNMPIGDAVKKFLKDIDDNYDDWLGFESKVQKLISEITTLTQQINKIRLLSSLHPVVGQALIRLVQNGVNEEEIIAIADLIKNDFSSRRDPSTRTGQSLIDDVRQYGSIKSTNYHLGEQADKLKKEVSSLQVEQIDLQSKNHKLIYSLQYSKKILDFFQKSIDLLEKEAVRLFSFTTVVSMSFLISINRSDGLKKLQDPNPRDEFESLRHPARGEKTDLLRLKKSVAKAIELLLLSISRKDYKLTRALTEARLLLLRDTNEIG
jgi:predicted  nucleic acid-binding Zn-ribbon protein